MISPTELIEKIQSQECSNEELNAFIKDTLKPLSREIASQVLEVLLPELFKALAQNTSVDTIIIVKTSISVQSAELIAKFLQEHKQITALNVSKTNLNVNGPVGSMAIAKALETNDSLLSLDYSNLSLYCKGAEIFAKAISTNKTLTSLNLEYCFLTDDGGKLVLEAMKENTSIRVLNIGSNFLKEKSFHTLIELLKSNQVLTALNYSDNAYPFLNDVTAFAQALTQNQSLRHLELNNNPFGLNGAQQIFTALEKNRTLLYLGFASTELGSKSYANAIMISAFLIKNETLQTLILDNNTFGNTDVEEIAAGLRHNSGLTELSLSGIYLASKGIRPLFNAIEDNRRLTKLVIEPKSDKFSAAQYGSDFDHYLEKINEVLEKNLKHKMRCNIAAAFHLSVDKKGNVTMIHRKGILLPVIVNLIFKYADCSTLPCLEESGDLDTISEEASAGKQNGTTAKNATKAFTPLLTQKREDEQQTESERLQEMFNDYQAVPKRSQLP